MRFGKAGFYAAQQGRHGKRNEGLRKAFEAPHAFVADVCRSSPWQAWLKSFVPCPWQLSGELCTILRAPQGSRLCGFEVPKKATVTSLYNE